ncbi:MAG: polysaccharide deacetylase family protein [Patescibacteria group bacterium]
MNNNCKILILYENKKFEGAIKYTFDLVMNILGLEYEISSFDKYDSSNLSEKLIIGYGRKNPQINSAHQIHICESELFWDNYLTPLSLPETPLNKYFDLPIIYQGTEKIESHIKNLNNSIETDIDIVASSFFMVARYEEIILKDRDKYDRFPATASLAYKEKFLDRPIVNEYIELLWKWIDSFNLGFKRKKIWNDKNFAVCLTHDIDEIFKHKRPPIFSMARSIKEKNIKKAATIFFDYLKTKLRLKEDPYYNAFDYITNLEKKYGFRSSFYFMTDGEQYSLKNKKVKNLIAKFKKEEFEIGIHPGFNEFNDIKILKSKKQELEKILGEKILGGRQHYLKWKIPESWKIWEEAELEYDATLGFAEYEGFKCGICHPFKPFDIQNNKVINIFEIPLIVMEGTLTTYRKLSPQSSLEILSKLLSTVEKYSGVFVFLWHNSFMTDLFTPEWKKCFENFYKIISQKNCSVVSAKTMLNLWKK